MILLISFNHNILLYHWYIFVFRVYENVKWIIIMFISMEIIICMYIEFKC